MSRPFQSRYLDFGAGPVHVADFGGDGPPVVCVHGLGGSHLNWTASAPALAELGHVTAIDLVGSGLTPAARRSATVGDNRELLDLYLRSLDNPAILVANSMGGTISILQSALAPDTVESLVLISPAVPPTFEGRPRPAVLAAFAAYLLPGVGELMMALRRRVVGPEETLLWVMRLCAYRPDLIPSDVLDAHMELARRRAQMDGVDRAFLESVRSLIIVLMRRFRFDEYLDRVRAPALVIAGNQDPLVHPLAIRRLMAVRPDWEFEFLDEVAHIAMLETPGILKMIIDGWLERTRA